MWYGLALFDGYLIPSRFIKENYIRLHQKMEANNATMLEYIISVDRPQVLTGSRHASPKLGVSNFGQGAWFLKTIPTHTQNWVRVFNLVLTIENKAKRKIAQSKCRNQMSGFIRF